MTVVITNTGTYTSPFRPLSIDSSIPSLIYLDLLVGDTSSRVAWTGEGLESIDVLAAGGLVGVGVGLSDRERLRLWLCELEHSGLDTTSVHRAFHFATNSALEETSVKCDDSSVSFHL